MMETKLCRNGLHLLTEDNLYKTTKNGKETVTCKACALESHKRYKLRKKLNIPLEGNEKKITLPDFCPQGHEYTPDNIKIKKRGNGWHRECKTCDQIRQHRIHQQDSIKERKRLYRIQYHVDHRDELCAKAKQWREDNVDRAKSNDLKKKYGITLEDKLAMFEAQGRKCAICSDTENHAKYSDITGWHLDHDHETGNIRSILCQPCNSMLGFAKESPERLIAAANYLEKHQNIQLLKNSLPKIQLNNSSVNELVHETRT